MPGLGKTRLLPRNVCGNFSSTGGATQRNLYLIKQMDRSLTPADQQLKSLFVVFPLPLRAPYRGPPTPAQKAFEACVLTNGWLLSSPDTLPVWYFTEECFGKNSVCLPEDWHRCVMKPMWKTASGSFSSTLCWGGTKHSTGLFGLGKRRHFTEWHCSQ